MTTGELRPDEATDPAEFVEMLRELKDRSRLTYRQLEQRAAATGDVLARSTAADILRRSTCRDPRWWPRSSGRAARKIRSRRGCGPGTASRSGHRPRRSRRQRTPAGRRASADHSRPRHRDRRRPPTASHPTSVHPSARGGAQCHPPTLVRAARAAGAARRRRPAGHARRGLLDRATRRRRARKGPRIGGCGPVRRARGSARSAPSAARTSASPRVAIAPASTPGDSGPAALHGGRPTGHLRWNRWPTECSSSTGTTRCSGRAASPSARRIPAGTCSNPGTRRIAARTGRSSCSFSNRPARRPTRTASGPTVRAVRRPARRRQRRVGRGAGRAVHDGPDQVFLVDALPKR